MLCEYMESIVTGATEKQFYLFIDEVQLTTKVVDKENGNIEVTIYDMLNELKAYKNLDVYVTGSNSKGLSKDIATEFRGRATQIHVFPLCFEEFYSAVGGDERKALDTYMLYGGMPRLLAMQEEKDKKDYLTSLYTELYVKDIVERNGIEREDILNDILNFLASQISSLTNPTNIANAIASMKNEKVNPALVSNYVQDIVDSFLISIAKRYDVKGKTYFNYPNKYYYTVLVSRYKANGLASITESHYHGNHRNLSYAEEEALLEPFRQASNAGKTVSVHDIETAYREAVGHSIGTSQIYYVLHRHGWRKVMPRSKHPKKASDEVIEISKKLTSESAN